jgi:hypothetical protein
MTLPRFWQHYRQLPREVQKLANKNFELLKSDPYHASLHFKKVGKNKHFGPCAWVRTIERWARTSPTEFYGFGIGTHSTYDKLLS